MSEIKICSKCGKEYPATKEYFYKDKGRLRSDCKECRKNQTKEYSIANKDKIKEYEKTRRVKDEKYYKYHKQYRERNKEKASEYRKQYYKNNKGKFCELHKKWCEQNKEKILEHRKRHYKNNKEKILERNAKLYEKNKEKISERHRKYNEENRDKILKWQKQYYIDNKEDKKRSHKIHYEKNRDKILERSRQYRKEHPADPIKNGLKWHRRRTAEQQVTATLTIEQWNFIKNHFNNRCCYCGKELPLQQDHYIPVTKGGSYSIDNIVPACIRCNSSKRDRWFETWYKNYKYYSEEREKAILDFINSTNKNEQEK